MQVKTIVANASEAPARNNQRRSSTDVTKFCLSLRLRPIYTRCVFPFSTHYPRRAWHRLPFGDGDFSWSSFGVPQTCVLRWPFCRTNSYCFDTFDLAIRWNREIWRRQNSFNILGVSQSQLSALRLSHFVSKKCRRFWRQPASITRLENNVRHRLSSFSISIARFQPAHSATALYKSVDRRKQCAHGWGECFAK